MKRLIAIAFCMLSLCFLAAETPESIMTKVMEVQSSKSSALDLLLTLKDAAGQTRERRIQTLSFSEKGETSTITIFLSPASVKNTRFLTLDDEQWIYLPALKRVKRISATEEGGSFMGSDFSYADMDSTTYDADQARHTLLSESEESYCIESVPFSSSVYGKTITWVDKTTFLPLLVEFYEKDRTTLIKKLTTEELDIIDNRWITKKLTMTTVSSGHSTSLEILQAKYDLDLDEGYFTTRFLETGRL